MRLALARRARLLQRQRGALTRPAVKLSQSGTPMLSDVVARMGYEAWRRNKRVEVTGLRNRVIASVVPFLPRTTVLGLVRNLQSPI
jgi:hypothetical protein